MTDETKVILKHYFHLRSKCGDATALRVFVEDLCAAKSDVRDTFADALKVATVLDDIKQPQRAPRKDKGTTRGPKPVPAVA